MCGLVHSPEELAAQLQETVRILDKRSPEGRHKEPAKTSKALPTNPLDGIFLRLNGQPELHGKPLNSTAEGCAHFIAASELPHLSTPTPLWIGVENAETFLHFESCRRHFPDFDFAMPRSCGDGAGVANGRHGFVNAPGN